MSRLLSARISDTPEKIIANISSLLAEWIDDPNNVSILTQVMNDAINEYQNARDARVNALGQPDEKLPQTDSAVTNVASFALNAARFTFATAVDLALPDTARNFVTALGTVTNERAKDFFLQLSKDNGSWSISNGVTRVSLNVLIIDKLVNAFYMQAMHAGHALKSDDEKVDFVSIESEDAKSASVDKILLDNRSNLLGTVLEDILRKRISPLTIQSQAEKIYQGVLSCNVTLNEQAQRPCSF